MAEEGKTVDGRHPLRPRGLDEEAYETAGPNAYCVRGVESERHQLLQDRATDLLRTNHPGCRTTATGALYAREEDDKGRPLYYKPDAMVVCGDGQWDKDRSLVERPTVLVEVLSASTGENDKTVKLAFYESLDSLQAYFMVDQSIRLVIAFIRDPNGAWQSFLGDKGELAYGREHRFDIDALYEGIL